MKIKTTLLLGLFGLTGALNAQMGIGPDTLYGNEWIDFSKTYYSIRVANDGVYRITTADLEAGGFPVGISPGAELRLYIYGRQVPLSTSTDGIFSSQDYLEFYGERNRDALDRFLFPNPDAENLNPWYSLVNDTAVYYLTAGGSDPALRYTGLPNDLSGAPAAEPYVWAGYEKVFTQAFFKREISFDIKYSWYNGDGFAADATSSSVVPIEPAQVWPGGPPAELRLRYGSNLGSHNHRISLDDSILASNQFSNFLIQDQEFQISPAALLGGPDLKIESQIGDNDRHALAVVVLRYARTPDFDGAASAAFELDPAAGKRYLEIEGFDLSGGAPVLYDRTNRLRLTGIVDGSTVKFQLPAATGIRQLTLVSPGGGLLAPPGLRPRQFRNFSAENAQFIIISNRAFFNDGAGGNPVEDYADYRAGASGGGFASTVIDIEELYAQFAYGVRFHPLAIRNFTHFVAKNWPDPQNLLLIGKGLNHPDFRSPDAQDQLADSLFFLPNIGSPGTDLLFVMSGNSIQRPLFGIGRLAVTEASQIRDYLEKVIDHEQELATAQQTLEDKAWLKRALHISGGLAGEQTAISHFVEDLSDELRSNMVGADVQTFYKTSNDPIQLTAYERVLKAINEGTSVWTIFGHSSAVGVDFDIGTPDNYSNKGRYPFMMILGCFSGQCSASQKGLGEKFVLERDKGAIAYLATVNYSFIDGLHAFGKRFYERMGGPEYGKSIGETVSETLASYSDATYPSLIAILHQIQLQGDPAVHLHRNTGPDYLVDRQSVAVTPNPVSIDKAQYELRFDVVNLGKNTGGPLSLRIRQRLPDQTIRLLLTDTIAAPALRLTKTYTLPTAGNQIGYSRIFITLDPDNAVEEAPAAAEFNNEVADASGEAGFDVYFYDDDVQPIFPPEFGIVRSAPVTLYASALALRATPKTYLFEIDTTELFNSQMRQTAQVTQPGGLLRWQPGLAFADSIVYFWRVARDSLTNGAVAWQTSSFLYLSGSAPGWHQGHFGQFQENTLVNMQLDSIARRLEFSDNGTLYFINVAYRVDPQVPGIFNSFSEGIVSYPYWDSHGIVRGVIICQYNPSTGHAYWNDSNDPANPNPGAPSIFWWFDTRDSSHRLRMMDFLENGLHPGAYVGLITVNYYTDSIGYAPQRWAADSITYGKNLFQVLEAKGAKQVRELANSPHPPYPYGILFQESANPTFTAVDTIVYSKDSLITIRRGIPANWTDGRMETPPIGPSQGWQSVHWRPGPADHPDDQSRLAVYGLREGQSDTLLLELDVPLDTALDISAETFPYLKLRYSATDSMSRTATPLRYARVLYQGLPEGALDPATLYSFYRDTLSQGDPLRAAIGFANVSDQPMDSVLVKFRVENASGSVGTDIFRRMRPLPIGDTLHLSLTHSTAALNGAQRLLIDVNPNGDQPELYHFNNVGIREFFVLRDGRNPLLDVTFDGTHVMDGDIVSPKPYIIVTLKDDNRFLAMQDTGTFRLTLRMPDGSTRPIYFSDPGVQFFPAQPGDLPKKNQARLEWQPVFTQDGEYQLLVNGRDATGNASASIDYAVRFRVITKSSLSNLLNYPNPFSTSTCFVYTMTGAETPTQFKLQIMTVSGKVVREVTAAEFGPLQAGTHRSNFCWDGKDQYGDQLAVGVYLYRVVARKADGSEFEFFGNNSIDGFFKGGFGKMVLIR